jgi:hypothetical protein
MTEVLMVEAADGYKVAFALAEVDPAFAVRDVIAADKRDGKPLDAKEGPLRVVAPGGQEARTLGPSGHSLEADCRKVIM